MADPGENLGGVFEGPRTAEGNDSGRDNDRDPIQLSSMKRKRSRKQKNSGGSQGPAQASPSGNTLDERREDDEGAGRNARQPMDIKKQSVLPVQEEHKAGFYERYRKVAEEYDKEFIKKYDEDLNTTLIFAGLFSAVASAFIIQVDSQLRPDPGDETAALLRVLIYKIDNATFGNDVPALPQWAGPPLTMVHVQAILFTSLAASLLSAFLAMLGKQWLNRYASTDMRGSVVERSQNRQRKLDGIIAWYFDSVMESLPVMLQVALLLLGCALTRYLWETSITIASVVLVVTSFGFLFYLFILVVGTAWGDCPYQTPGSRVFRYLGPRVRKIVFSAARSAASPLRNVLEGSMVVEIVTVELRNPDWSSWRNMALLAAFVLGIPILICIDLYRLGRAAVRALPTLPTAAYYIHTAYSSLRRVFNQRTAALDLRCISWTLQTSLEQPVHLSTLKHLVTITELANLDPMLVIDCFNLFVGCVSISNGKLVVTQGMEQLATLSARCFFQTLEHLSVTHPTSSILADLRRRYNRILPNGTDFRGLPFYHTMTKIQASVNWYYPHHFVWWTDYHPSNQELIPFARHMVDAAKAEYQQEEDETVPSWILRFALRFLSFHKPSPPSVIADCLTVIAIALNCDISSVPILDESVRVELISNPIIQELETMAGAPGTNPAFQSKQRAVNALYPYAIRLAQDGQRGLIEVMLRVSPKLTDDRSTDNSYGLDITTLFDRSNPSCWNPANTLVLCDYDWINGGYGWDSVSVWAAQVLITPYSEEVGWRVVDALLQIVSNDSLQQHIPIDVWAWLKRLPSLPPDCLGRYHATTSQVVLYVRGLRDIEILKSYLLLVWSEWDHPFNSGLFQMEDIIKEEFGGIAMRHHREDLTNRLDHVLGELDRGLEYFKQHSSRIGEDGIQHRKELYGQLKKLFEEQEEEIKGSSDPT